MSNLWRLRQQWHHQQQLIPASATEHKHQPSLLDSALQLIPAEHHTSDLPPQHTTEPAQEVTRLEPDAWNEQMAILGQKCHWTDKAVAAFEPWIQKVKTCRQGPETTRTYKLFGGSSWFNAEELQVHLGAAMDLSKQLPAPVAGAPAHAAVILSPPIQGPCTLRSNPPKAAHSSSMPADEAPYAMFPEANSNSNRPVTASKRCQQERASHDKKRASPSASAQGQQKRPRLQQATMATVTRHQDQLKLKFAVPKANKAHPGPGAAAAISSHVQGGAPTLAAFNKNRTAVLPAASNKNRPAGAATSAVERVKPGKSVAPVGCARVLCVAADDDASAFELDEYRCPTWKPIEQEEFAKILRYNSQDAAANVCMDCNINSNFKGFGAGPPGRRTAAAGSAAAVAAAVGAPSVSLPGCIQPASTHTPSAAVSYQPDPATSSATDLAQQQHSWFSWQQQLDLQQPNCTCCSMCNSMRAAQQVEDEKLHAELSVLKKQRAADQLLHTALKQKSDAAVAKAAVLEQELTELQYLKGLMAMLTGLKKHQHQQEQQQEQREQGQ